MALIPEEHVISVIMPSFNHERFIDDAMRSVLSQPLSILELIVVDDGSTDRSAEIIRKWASQDHSIRAIFHSENLGISRTVNDGIDIAKGKYVTFIASDDMFAPHALERALRAIEKDSTFGAVVFEVRWIDDTNRSITLFSNYFAGITGQRVDFLRDMQSLQRETLFNLLVRSEGLIGLDCLVRKKVLDEYNIRLDERVKYGNDNLFGLELSLACEMTYTGEPLYLHRIHKDNTYNTIKKRDALNADYINCLETVLNKYWALLEEKTKRILFDRLGRSYLTAGNFPKSHDCFAMSAAHNPYSGRTRIVLMLLCLRIASVNRILFLYVRKLQQIRTWILERVTPEGKQRRYFSKIFATIWEIDK
jgi:glycosyltransferase involved in cell wall biosynthesis